MNEIAEEYVRLVLAVGRHDADSLDAYYGPPEWREEEERLDRSLDEVLAAARRLAGTIDALPVADDEMEALRATYLAKQLRALAARVELLQGVRPTFDEETRALYDVTAPYHEDAHFEELLEELEPLLPGAGTLGERYALFRSRFEIPLDRLDAVFPKAIAVARERTAARISLPPGESFTVEYVRDQPWSGYNWYQGDYRSLIQVNTDLPVGIDRAVDLACHEGYPGHHVYNVLQENHLVRERGWVEFSVYPLFSPHALISEGTANFGIDVCFPGPERTAFEAEALYPLAGLDPETAAPYRRVLEIAGKLAYAGNEVARAYLDGAIDRAAALERLGRLSLMSPERAAQRLRFIERYRSYVINYNVGKDLVRGYLESRGGTADAPDRRWEEFARLLSSPRLPSALS